ncbi:TPA: class III signal peptide-containing protein [Methanocaldococcus jannaschii]|uniref:Probable pilin MJ1400 n=2 Tax=Methanocaldococcus jannaschii TaxID=2190 RepID=Y1400_METJA|nr:class III signal peptide-containing protein [Methanocaldococcus jannaschii]Q58795.1 RecName: Full=UPF0333 protein MJ1400 [Methanocaldococcus jannaschii DSM 2661]AAB99411.1 hypothetical protein MJ_1400 [Methanocaldococcus jannaschii DSM 2661]HII59119.1 class III signal peptide-containing protein [Methanocaldococcus jannaschii]
MKFIMKFIKSNKGQISLEFSLLVMVVVLSAIIVSYYLIKTAIETRNANMDVINQSSNVAEKSLSNVT